MFFEIVKSNSSSDTQMTDKISGFNHSEAAVDFFYYNIGLEKNCFWF